MNAWFGAAAVLSAGYTLLHMLAGGASAARPLLSTGDLDFVAKYTNYYCWHLVSIMLAALAVMFGYAALYPSGIELGVAATLLSIAFAALSFGLIAWIGRGLWDLPQWGLFVLLASVGGAGVVN